MRITRRLADACPNGLDCPRIHDTDGDHVIVQGDRVTDPAVLEHLHLPEHETAVSVPRGLIYPQPMSLAELGDWIGRHHDSHLFRLENRDAYSSVSDGGDFARFVAGEDGPLEGAAWRDRLERDIAAGRHWTKVHVVRGALSDYERYCAAWPWPRTTDAGEDLRVLEAGPYDLEGVPDFFVLERRHVVRSSYDDTGRFVGAHVVPEPDAAVYRDLAARVWADSVPFAAWWDAHPLEHRNRNAA